MKYFLHIDTYIIYCVPKKHYKHIDIINSKSSEHDDDEVNDSIAFIRNNCKALMKIDALSQTL